MSLLLRLMRLLLHLPQPQITAVEAVEIAIAELTRRGEAPSPSGHSAPKAMEQLTSWKVLIRPGFIECWWLVIDNQSGQVKSYVVPHR